MTEAVLPETAARASVPEGIVALGDSAVIVHLGHAIDLATHRRVKHFSESLERNPFPGFVESVPAYASVGAFYDAVKVSRWLKAAGRIESPFAFVCSFLEELRDKMGQAPEVDSRIVDIPVCYGGEYGPDLELVARHNGLTPEEVIAIHCQAEYLVHMIGFLPGYPYLGGMSSLIATPRRETPRLTVPAGSVGIGGAQTGIYPFDSPGGWQIIGRTTERLFSPDRTPPALLATGDTVRFSAIDAGEFARRVNDQPGAGS
jgi:inhibitor of KinA